MRSSLGFILAAVFSFAAICILPNTAAARVEAGLLTCEVGEGFALIVSKPRDLHCIFHKSNGQNEAYRGKLREIGIDIGVSGRGVIVWTVIAGTTELPPGELAGSYGGVEAGAAAVVGGRGAVLIGGAEKTISLQPLSVEVEAGLNIAVGITSMELHPYSRGGLPRITHGFPPLAFLALSFRIPARSLITGAVRIPICSGGRRSRVSPAHAASRSKHCSMPIRKSLM